ncbi:hypothetical protein [Methylocystis parvus]|uniref:Mll5186 protein n=1 Tax=Methylocystis parvus TaxID=134 RepID=A0A6B8M057_9HYPH|nr:hypothetical protein [Methylocystis parvus]QGM97104.1 hypothetical protein F7D14_06190 [Methylocystis parvus]WBJ98993.1 hypothetical protein MMG94_13420 [Methylocystis parvus OBBP]
MTDVIRPGYAPGAPVATERAGFVSAVDWGAILAGVAVATAISFVMAAFGSGIGLSLASPYEGASPMTHAIALALWVIWVTVASYAAGGYVCGRLRRRNIDAPREEAEVRDGAHGLTVWATCMIIVALALGSSLYNLGKAGVDTATQQAQKSGLVSNPVDYRVDTLMRGDGGGAQRAGTPAPIATTADTRQIVSRIIARGQATGEIGDQDRIYLQNLLASSTGLSPADARARVDSVMQQVRDDNARAKDVADKARKAGIMASFIAAAAMLLAAASAWSGAVMGGRHRDENIGLSAAMRW